MRLCSSPVQFACAAPHPAPARVRPAPFACCAGSRESHHLVAAPARLAGLRRGHRRQVHTLLEHRQRTAHQLHRHRQPGAQAWTRAKTHREWAGRAWPGAQAQALPGVRRRSRACACRRSTYLLSWAGSCVWPWVACVQTFARLAALASACLGPERNTFHQLALWHARATQTRAHTHAHMHVRMYACVLAHLHARTCPRISPRCRTCTRALTNTRAHVCVHAGVQPGVVQKRQRDRVHARVQPEPDCGVEVPQHDQACHAHRAHTEVRTGAKGGQAGVRGARVEGRQDARRAPGCLDVCIYYMYSYFLFGLKAGLCVRLRRT